MKRKECGLGLFYTRDSGGRHETTPAEYIKWAQREAAALEVKFSGTPDTITEMIETGKSVQGDLYLDYEVSGHLLSRPGLDQLIGRATVDPNVSHVFVPRRDRLARPNDPIDALLIEKQLRQSGLTLVFMDRVLPPLSKGQRQDFMDQMSAMMDYEQAGKFRRELSQKMIYAQIALAKAGFSTGGRPPFAFDRWLAKADGTKVRKLMDGEIVRMAGHHVIWLPATDGRLKIALRIRSLLEKMPASQVCKILNAEGVPSPDAGRMRTDNDVPHKVSGLWHQSTIINIGRNPLLAAISCYGVRSMGDQSRFTPDGPRDLKEEDFRHDSPDNKPKVVRNPEGQVIKAPAKFAPIVTPAEHERLQGILDERAGTQRGKPRSRDPKRNPLGSRVFDWNCTWPMYRVTHKESFRYKCGLYQQTHGQQCDHNHVDGPTATRFALSCIRQRLSAPGMSAKLKQRLVQLAHSEPSREDVDQHEFLQARQDLADVKDQLTTVTRNLALAKDGDQFREISTIFNELKQHQRQLEEQLAAMESRQRRSDSSERDIDDLLKLADQLTRLANAPEDFTLAEKLFNLVNIQLFLKFKPQKLKKRTVNRLAGGVVTFGASDLPIQIYHGPTATKKIKHLGTDVTKLAPPVLQKTHSSHGKNAGSGGEGGKSLRNVSRDDRI